MFEGTRWVIRRKSKEYVDNTMAKRKGTKLQTMADIHTTPPPHHPKKN